jgi:hypothetical protein
LPAEATSFAGYAELIGEPTAWTISKCSTESIEAPLGWASSEEVLDPFLKLVPGLRETFADTEMATDACAEACPREQPYPWAAEPETKPIDETPDREPEPARGAFGASIEPA